MNKGYQRPKTPAKTERALRQESGFGCAKCGHPYIEYHHIIPYAEEQHFRAEDMVALCGNCHPAVAKLGRDMQYEIKHTPYNTAKGILEGALQYDKRNMVFKVGSNWYENVPTILQYYNLPIITCALHEGQAKVSLNLLNRKGKIIFSVSENNVVFRVDDLWDFEYAHNFVVVRYGPRDIALRMDFRKEEATIEGKIWLGDQQVILGPNHTSLPNNNIVSNCIFSNSRIGIQVGESNNPAGFFMQR